MQLKFVILEHETLGKIPVIFPEKLVHKDVAHAVCRAAHRSDYQPLYLEPVSAGFVEYGVKDSKFYAMAYGRSESLDLEALPGDSELLTKFIVEQH